jgi:hypothetical protein
MQFAFSLRPEFNELRNSFFYRRSDTEKYIVLFCMPAIGFAADEEHEEFG